VATEVVEEVAQEEAAVVQEEDQEVDQETEPLVPIRASLDGARVL